ncbi:hypothetical protein MTAT_14780 [Moorella thermoacetica]|uniref:Formiminotransferase C-terminal subdomain domain-containing protein n=1 Tax=Neomoorella thermoacetica TaxID=1525 RepID=A0A1D7X6T7_NEOTH|nr:hypothetical protein [Moorella thermoacetica]AOQ22607.1 hypothetical protein Maut_00114 [Moorella thermoacetica]OIQ10293.1 hypothetical protein MOOR_03750 [Moorella thermoacetica]TYL13148.1 hypothetical protein MTAT_14780 [Moorella thermoacetica]
MPGFLEYTLYLSTDDVRVAHHLARILNQKGGRDVVARGQESERGAAVVVRIFGWQEFSLVRVLETVRAGARNYNVQVTGGNLSPAPVEALLAVVQHALLLDRLPLIAGATPREPLREASGRKADASTV